jgi:short-subunit dehydrogenase
MSYWQGKTAIVTGGSSGLGAALARELARRGAGVVAVARGRERLEEVCSDLAKRGGAAHPIAADITRDRDVEEIVRATVDRFGTIDLLVNCAGRSERARVLDTTPEDLQALWEINLLSTVRMTRACAVRLAESHGHVVNIGSLASKTAGPFLGAYPATKHAVAAYTQQLRLELSARGLHALLVCPGPIARSGSEHRYGESGDVPAEALRPGGGASVRPLDPQLLAAEILKACERRKPELVRPRRARLLFAAAAIAPSFGDWLIRRLTAGDARTADRQ